MDEQKKLSLEEFRKLLNPKEIRTIQIVHFALGAGAVAFFLVVFFLYMNGPENPTSEAATLNVFSMTLLVFAVVAYPLARWLPEQFYENSLVADSLRKNLPKAKNQADEFLSLFRMASVMRLGIMEGVAFFGLVVCFLGAQSGALNTHPIYWLNVIPTIILLIHVLLNIPNQNKIEDKYRIKVVERKEVVSL